MSIWKVSLILILINLFSCNAKNKDYSLTQNLYSPKSKIFALLEKYDKRKLKYLKKFFASPINTNFKLFKKNVVQLQSENKFYFKNTFLQKSFFKKHSGIFNSEKALILFLSNCRNSLSFLFSANQYLTSIINNHTKEDKRHIINLRKLIFLQLTNPI